MKDYLPNKFEASRAKHNLESFKLHKIWEVHMIFDLDLLTCMDIKREHLLIKAYIPTKFEVSREKSSLVIGCTRLQETDIICQTDKHVQSNKNAPPSSIE